MSFKVLFVYPNIGTHISFSPAIQILSAVLKREGYETALLHLHNEHGTKNERNEINKVIQKEKPDLIGFTSTSFEYDEADKITGNIKQDFPDIPVILGGVHATIMQSDLEKSNFDAFCIGEGEWNLLELIKKMEKGEDYTNTPSFFFKSKDKVIKNKLKPIVENMDNLPFYDMEIMDTKKILELRNKWLSIGFSRGCPYDCSFCINPLLRKIKVGDDAKRYLRKRNVENVISELESIVKKYKDYVEVFNFDDDLLMLDQPWMMDYIKEYKQRIFNKHGIEYAINARVNTMQDEMIEGMSKSGCREIRIGFETGDPEQRKNILNKPISDEQLINAFDTCHKYNIRASAFSMLGIPGESHETIQKTLKLLARLKPYLIRMTFLFPYYHTAIHDHCKDNNLFRKNWMEVDEFTVSPLKFDKLTDDEILKYKHMFPWYLNTVMLPESNAKQYKKLIEQFLPMSFEEFKNAKDKILEQDEKVSKEMSEIPHYRYFRNNLYYYQLLSPEIKQGGEESD